MVYKNSKKKNNNLKPVIKTSYKKVNVNRKKNTKNTKKNGGGAWGEFKEWSQKSLGRYKGVGVKVKNETGAIKTGAIKFFSRQERGLSKFKIGRNYKSSGQMKEGLNYMTDRINEKKQEFTVLHNKLSGRQFNFDALVKNKLTKFKNSVKKEEELLSKLKDTNPIKYNRKVLELEAKQKKVFKEIENEKKLFTKKNKKLIKNISKKKKNLDRVSKRYSSRIKKLENKLEEKLRKSEKLFTKALSRTCNKSSNKNCSTALRECFESIGVNTTKMSRCMQQKGIKDFTEEALKANIIKTKLYYSPMRRNKIRARSARIERTPETQKVLDETRGTVSQTDKFLKEQSTNSAEKLESNMSKSILKAKGKHLNDTKDMLQIKHSNKTSLPNGKKITQDTQHLSPLGQFKK